MKHRAAPPGLLTSQSLIKPMILLLLLSLVAHILVTLQPDFQDERAVIENVRHFLAKKTIIPPHTAYPTLYSYLITPVVSAFATALLAVDIPPVVHDCAALARFEPLYVLWPARLVTFFAWVGVAWIVYRISRELLLGPASALLSCVAMASALGMLRYSGYALPDVTMTLFAGACLLNILRVSRGESAERAAVLAGVFAGLAMATKYTAIAMVPPAILGAWLAPTADWRARLGLSARTLTGALIGFLVGCPGWAIVPDTYWHGLQAERIHMATGHSGCMGIPVLGQLELLLRADGFLLMVAFLGSLAAACLKRRRQPRTLAILLSVIAFTVLLAAPAKKQSLQYLFTLYPALAILVALPFASIGKRQAVVAGVACLCGFAATTLWGLLWAFRVAVLPCSIEVADKWIRTHIPDDAVLALDWDYVPRLLSGEKLQDIKSKARTPFVRNLYEALVGYETVPIAHEADFLETTHAAYLVTSSYCYDRWFTHGIATGLPPPPGSPLRQNFLQHRQFYSLLFGGKTTWRLEYEVYTGNGPSVRVFRNQQPSNPVAQSMR